MAAPQTSPDSIFSSFEIRTAFKRTESFQINSERYIKLLFIFYSYKLQRLCLYSGYIEKHFHCWDLGNTIPEVYASRAQQLVLNLFYLQRTKNIKHQSKNTLNHNTTVKQGVMLTQSYAWASECTLRRDLKWPNDVVQHLISNALLQRQGAATEKAQSPLDFRRDLGTFKKKTKKTLLNLLKP